MEETYSKYIRLFGNIFFTFLGFVVVNMLVLLLLRFIFGLVDQLPVTVYIYMLLILIFPAALFITVFIIYFRRTRHHPSAGVRYFSWAIFTVALLLWGTAFVMDLVTFFKTGHHEIMYYKSYELAFLAGNIGTIFLVGIIQALTTKKEVDWMDRHRNGA